MESINILKAPIVTEKSTNSQASGKYFFLVHQDANKTQVRKVIETAYGVKVKSVQMMPIIKKQRLAGRGYSITKRHAGKKAIVTLEKNQTIDVNKIKVQ